MVSMVWNKCVENINMSNSPDFNYLATKPEPGLSIAYAPAASNTDVPFLADTELSRDFDFCVPDILHVKVFLAIYDIMLIGATNPCLKYMVEIGETATFPSFEIACADDNPEHFKTEAVLFLMQVLNMGEESGDVYERAFRGMVFNPEHKCVVAVFDYRECKSTQTHTKTWAVVDELVFERRVWNVPVDKAVSDTMRQNALLWTLPNADPPISLYMIKETGEGVFATDVSPSAEAPTLFMHGDTIDTYKYGDEYGDMYIFSQKPLFDDGTGSDRKYARYAVFAHGAKYLLEDQYHHAYLESLDAEEDQESESGESEPEEEEEDELVDAIYFVEDKITKVPTQLWGIKESSRFVRI